MTPAVALPDCECAQQCGRPLAADCVEKAEKGTKVPEARIFSRRDGNPIRPAALTDH
jgi:hypothetical protein